MISEASSFTTVFGANPAGGDVSPLHPARAAVLAGYAIVPCKPGTKQPMCTLTSRDVKTADEMARETARQAGRRKWELVKHDCGIKHAITDIAEVNRVIPRLIKHFDTVNLGIELGRSRMVVVDVDTDAEAAAFAASWRAETGTEPPPMTVSSPGVVDVGGTWRHKNGGHYWFTVPEGVNLPTADGALKDATGWVVMWADRQVLVPPSVRPEGPYRLVGETYALPRWILLKILAHAVERKRRLEAQAERRENRLSSGDGYAHIDAWSAATPWSELLEPDGWYNTTVPDSCGCDIWTAPPLADGTEHASSKSATAHDVGCANPLYDDSEGHLPLHVWTDNPPEFLLGFDKTFSKIQYMSRRWFGDDGPNSVRQVCRELRIPAEGGRAGLTSIAAQAIVPNPSLTVTRDPLAVPSAPSGTAGALGALPSMTTSGSSPNGHVSMAPASDMAPGFSTEPEKVWYFADEFEDVPEREQLIENMILVGSYVRVIGKSNHGKSFLAVDLAGHVATGMAWHGQTVQQGRVAYIAAEDSPGIMVRVRAWEKHHEVKLGKQFLLRIDGVQVSQNDAWTQLVADMKGYAPSIIFFDTQAASTYGIKENDNDEGDFMNEQMKALRQATGATVTLIHHKGHTGEHGRGASSVLGALDTEISIAKDDERGERGTTNVEISCTKQRWAQEFPPFMAQIVAEPGTTSAVLRVPNDPMNEVRDAVAGAMSVREKVARYVFGVGNGLGGVTITEMRTALRKSKSSPRGIHHEALNREWKKFIENGHLLDAVTGHVIVPEGVGESTETVLASNSRRVILAPGIVQELGLELS